MNGSLIEWPSDADVSVVPLNDLFAFDIPRRVDFVVDDAVLQCQKSMSETFWNEQHVFFDGIKLATKLLHECRSALPKIDSDIENEPGHASDKFGLRTGRSLQMQATKNTLARKGFIVLNEFQFTSSRLF